MNDNFLQIRALATKEIADVRRSSLLLVVTVFMLLASFVSLVVAAVALKADVTAYNSARDLLLSLGKSIDELVPPAFMPLTLLRGFVEYIEIIGAVLGIVLGHRAAAAERGRNTLPLLLTRPMSTLTFVIGKCLGNFAIIGGVLLLTFSFGALGLVVIGGIGLTADDLVRVVTTLTAASVYVGFFFVLGLFLALNMRRSVHAVLLAFTLWIGFVLVTPQIGDTLDPDNQVGAGVFRTLNIAKPQEKEIMKSFKTYETLRDGIEQSSPAKHFERFSFAVLGIKDIYAGQSLQAVLKERQNDVFWLFGLFASLLGVLTIFPLNVNKLKES
ncbi:ABC transporter permease [Aeromonas sp. EERV15]|uniref:ABC transporter permease n=1 Tax=Aeromonas sp. EERV15 TaxID=1833892 RepID=UPI00083B2D46|nr:ABC transporter permease subunit [Aeromonas sp. EERV15]